MAIAKKRKLFVDDGRRHGTVILNWHGTPESEFTYFAEAFRVTAQKSLKELKASRYFGRNGIPVEDFKAYPVVFLYRHALELYMKAVCLIGSEMLTLKGEPGLDRERLLKTHNLDVLRQDLERVFAAYGWGWDLSNATFRSVKDVRTVIGEFHTIDERSDAFRYPVNTKGGAALHKGFQFNVFTFCSVLDDLFPTLEGAAIGAYEEYQSQLQALGEAQEYESSHADYDPTENDYEQEYDYYELDEYEAPHE